MRSKSQKVADKVYYSKPEIKEKRSNNEVTVKIHPIIHKEFTEAKLAYGAKSINEFLKKLLDNFKRSTHQ